MTARSTASILTAVCLVLPSAARAEEKPYDLDDIYAHIKLSLGTIGTTDDSGDSYTGGSNFNVGGSLFLEYGYLAMMEAEMSLGNSDKGFYVLELLNIDVGIGFPIEFGESNNLYLGFSPFSILLASPESCYGLSVLAKYQLERALLEYKVIALKYGEGREGKVHGFGASYWVTDNWGLGAQADLYNEDTTNYAMTVNYAAW